MSKLAEFWGNRIKWDINRIDEVPKLWRDEVRAMIEGE